MRQAGRAVTAPASDPGSSNIGLARATGSWGPGGPADLFPGRPGPGTDVVLGQRRVGQPGHQPCPAAGKGAGTVGATDKSIAFMAMPFSREDLQIVYADFVKPVVEMKCGFQCVRGDEMFGSDVIMEDVLTVLRRARVVIADLTGQNPNVFYEVGIAHAIGAPVLLLTQSLADVPFDLRHRRIQVYEYSPRGCKHLEGRLEDHLQHMLAP